MANRLTVGVIGNPNCGKSTLFNALTGGSQTVGNWPGVTVEKKAGEYSFNGQLVKIVDLPGTYSLESTDDSVSLDEKIARDFISSGQADLIVNIVDASNLERHLYLTAQLAEMQTPIILALNMMDVVKKRGIQVNVERIAEHLGCPVLAISAVKNEGITYLKEAIDQFTPDTESKKAPIIHYAASLERAIKVLSNALMLGGKTYPYDLRWLALKLLEGDSLANTIAEPNLQPLVMELQAKVENETQEEIDILAADARYSFVNAVTQDAVCKIGDVGRQVTDKIDQIVLNRYLGIPIFLLAMYAMFMFTINFGTAFIDFFEQASGAFVVDGFKALLEAIHWPQWLIMVLADGLGGGIQVVVTFIPIVGFLFLFLSMLEDSGYMARAAFVMDRFMRLIGLPGKSFVPMIVGFGCNVPAIMATRTLESERDRILTNLMNPFMSCGARLPVYALFAAAFFPVGGQNIVFGLYLFGIAIAVLTGLIMRHTVFQGDSSPFVMELPTYHRPSIKGVFLRTWGRLQTFLFNAGKVIVPMVLILNCLNAIGTDGSLGNENSNRSVLSAIGRSLAPVFKPMGITEDNWPATVGIFTGVMAKEAVVGTLDALYGQMGKDGAYEESDNTNFNLETALLAALNTIPENFGKLTNKVADPLGMDVAAAANEQDVNKATFKAMQSSFDGKAGAFAYLLFILLYAPCVSATAAIYRETNLNWTLFVVAWTTGLAYLAAVVFYQAVTYDQHPGYSFAWISGLLFTFALAVLALKWLGRTSNRPRRYQRAMP